MGIVDWEDEASARLKQELQRMAPPVFFDQVHVPSIVSGAVFFVGRVKRGIRRRIKRS